MGIQKRFLEERIICNHCSFEGDHKISLKFFAPDLERIKNKKQLKVGFNIKCVCGNCGRYIKNLPYYPYLELLDDKEINY